MSHINRLLLEHISVISKVLFKKTKLKTSQKSLLKDCVMLNMSTLHWRIDQA